MNTVRRRSLVRRAVGAALLRVDAYEEVEHDERALGQAALVVGAVALATAAGALERGPGAVLAAILSAYLGWLLWAAVTDVVGSRVFGGTATWGELLRTLGFAQAPGILRALGAASVLAPGVEIITFLWLFATGIVAIRQALDLDTGQALITAFLAWLVFVGASSLLSFLLGGALVLEDPIG